MTGRELGWVALVASALFVPTGARADDGRPAGDSDVAEDGAGPPVLSIRPHAGGGWTGSYNESGDGVAWHVGGRVLMSAGPFQRFGLEVTYLDLDGRQGVAFEQRYLALGIVLEMTLFEHFVMGIGTIGYVGLGADDGTPFGIVTNLGWEPAWEHAVAPFITLRSEWIIGDVVFNVLSLSGGVRFDLTGR